MRQTVVTLMLTIFTLGIVAQDSLKDDMNVLQSIYGKAKKEIVSQTMNLSGAQASDFWGIYEQYEEARKALGMEKVKNIKVYTSNLDRLTDDKADIIAKTALKNALGYNKLQKKYFNKVKKVVGALNAAKFMQLENYLQTRIDFESQIALPFIFELEHMAK